MFPVAYFQQLIVEFNIATTKLSNVALYSNERCFLYIYCVIIPQNVPKKEHSGTFAISKLFSKNQLEMEHSRLALSRFLILLPELYAKRPFLVNGTAWHKAIKSSKKELSGNCINL